MSSSGCIGYFGLRYDLTADDIDQLEERSDSRQIAAKKVGLSTYWTNFGGDTKRYVLFVGTRIAALGPENEMTVGLPMERVLSIASDTADRLRSAGLAGDVGLYLEWLADA